MGVALRIEPDVMNRVQTQENAVKMHFLVRGTLTALVAAVALGGAGLGMAHAQRSVVKPAAKSWCGLTDQNGSVRITLSDDLRFAQTVDIQQGPPETLHLTTAEGNFAGTGLAAINDEQFIFRRNRLETNCRPANQPGPNPPPGGRCTRAPCRGTDPICSTRDVNTLMIRGLFDSPENMHGSFSALIAETTTTGRGSTREKRVIGSFIAWPEGVAPCP